MEEKEAEALVIVREVQRAPVPGEGELWGREGGTAVRGPGEAELRGLETLDVETQGRRTQIHFQIFSQGK